MALVRRLERDHALFSRTGRYRYRGGWNPAAVVAFAVSAFVALVGLAPSLSWLYAYHWFLGVGVGVGAVTYLLLMLPTARRQRSG